MPCHHHQRKTLLLILVFNASSIAWLNAYHRVDFTSSGMQNQRSREKLDGRSSMQRRAVALAADAGSPVKWHGTAVARLLPHDGIHEGKFSFGTHHDLAPTTGGPRLPSRVPPTFGNAPRKLPPQTRIPWTSLPFSNRAFTKLDLFQKSIDLSDHRNDLDDKELVVTLDVTFVPTECNEAEDHSDDEDADHVVHMHMTRDPNETASRTLRRFELSTSKRLKEGISKDEKFMLAQEKKSGRTGELEREDSTQSNANSENSAVVVTLDDEVVDATKLSTSADLWRMAADALYCKNKSGDSRSGMEIWLPDQLVHVKVIPFPPTILEVHTFESFDGEVFVGVPLYIECDLLYADKYVVTWYLDNKETAHDVKFYIPTEADIGKEVRVRVVPIRDGHDGTNCEETRRFSNEVKPLPFMPIVSPLRDEWKGRNSSHRVEGKAFCSCELDLRVLSYNLLADIYASRELDKRDQFAYCELPFLMRSRRVPMLVAEILEYEPDVICLQEVDDVVFDNMLRPAFDVMGYQGFFSVKISEQREGCAIFWSKSCFDVAGEEDMHTYSIGDLFNAKESNGWDSMKDIKKLMEDHEELRSVTKEKIGQVLQVVTLNLKPSQEVAAISGDRPEKVVLANTHLFYHPLASHIRAMQAFVVCRKIDEIRRAGTFYPLPFVLSGDFNSRPGTGAIDLLINGTLLPGHQNCWDHLNRYVWEMGDKELFEVDEEHHTTHFKLEECLDAAEQNDGDVTPPTLHFPPSFPSLFSGYETLPEFTNYVPSFVETLDYILASRPSQSDPFGFAPKQSAAMPSREDMSRFYAMPNEFMPSDHVSIVCDLEWRKHDPDESIACTDKS